MSAEEKSRQWLEDWGRRTGEDWQRTVDAAQGHVSNAYVEDFGYDGKKMILIHFNDEDAHGEIEPEFWDHVEIVTGFSMPQADRPVGFSCSC